MIEALLDTWGEPPVTAGAGLVTGLVFGAAAQHSRFCLRAATVEVAGGVLGPRLAIWLVAFFAALATTQAAVWAGAVDLTSARQLASPGSLAGAVIGGLMFGVGMILARGCASRLLVLSATGNLRALVAGLVVTLVAQASLTGVLAPLRERISLLAIVEGGAQRDLALRFGIGRGVIVLVAVAGLALGVWLARRHRVPLGQVLAGAVVGLAVALGWFLTFMVASVSFDIVPIGSVTFTGPSTDTLMTLVARREVVLSFGIGLVPGVFISAMIAAVAKGEWRIERFGADTPVERYLVGAVLMGFGAMLAGGCAVGAGVTGGAILSLTAWVAVAAMWAGALLAQWVIQWRSTSAQPVV